MIKCLKTIKCIRRNGEYVRIKCLKPIRHEGRCANKVRQL